MYRSIEFLVSIGYREMPCQNIYNDWTICVQNYFGSAIKFQQSRWHSEELRNTFIIVIVKILKCFAKKLELWYVLTFSPPKSKK